MATHSSVLAWRIPGTGEPGGLPSMGWHRVGHDWSDLAAAAAAAAELRNSLTWLLPVFEYYHNLNSSRKVLPYFSICWISASYHPSSNVISPLQQLLIPSPSSRNIFSSLQLHMTFTVLIISTFCKVICVSFWNVAPRPEKRPSSLP